MSPAAAATEPAVVAPVLGHVIALARKARGVSQPRLAEAVGVAQPTVSAWENGRLRPSLEQLVKIRRALDADVGAFWDAVETELEGQLPDPLT